jgi:hypothetical protein
VCMCMRALVVLALPVLLCSFVPPFDSLSILSALVSRSRRLLLQMALALSLCITFELRGSRRRVDGVGRLDEFGEERIEGEESADVVLWEGQRGSTHVTSRRDEL